MFAFLCQIYGFCGGILFKLNYCSDCACAGISRHEGQGFAHGIYDIKTLDTDRDMGIAQ